MDASEKVEQLEGQLEKLGKRGRNLPPGPGRKRGSLNRKTTLKLLQMEEDLRKGKLPLDVMLEHMRFANEKSHELTKDFIQRVDKDVPRDDPKAMVACLEQVVTMFQELRAWRTLALDAATRAAPYCHPKLNAIAMKVNDPEGTRSIVDINLIAASGVAVSEILEQGVRDHRVTIDGQKVEHQGNGTTPGEGEPDPHNGTTPANNGTTPEAPDDSVEIHEETLETGSESGDTADPAG